MSSRWLSWRLKVWRRRLVETSQLLQEFDQDPWIAMGSYTQAETREHLELGVSLAHYKVDCIWRRVALPRARIVSDTRRAGIRRN